MVLHYNNIGFVQIFPGRCNKAGNSTSLLPAHISAAININEWLAGKNKAPVAAAAAEAISGRQNIMAPVLRSTSAEYWLDRKGRPSVSERGKYSTLDS